MLTHFCKRRATGCENCDGARVLPPGTKPLAGWFLQPLEHPPAVGFRRAKTTPLWRFRRNLMSIAVFPFLMLMLLSPFVVLTLTVATAGRAMEDGRLESAHTQRDQRRGDCFPGPGRVRRAYQFHNMAEEPSA